jgi:hypothetical protein
MVVMFTGLLFFHAPKGGNKGLALTVIIGGALLMVVSLYTWFLTPLEDEH